MDSQRKMYKAFSYSHGKTYMGSHEKIVVGSHGKVHTAVEAKPPNFPFYRGK